VRQWLSDTVAVHAHTQYEKKWEWADVVGTVDGEPRIIGYVLERDTADVPCTAYGFVRPFAAFAGMSLAKSLKYWPVLPVSLTGGAPNDSLLSVTVSNLDGYPLYRTAVQYEPRYDGRFEIVAALGGLRVDVALRPETANRLVIGGLPHSRLPLLLGLLGLTAGLVFVALLQLRRESELNRLRAGFISNVSHELRTPLAQIRMFAETLLLGRVRSPDEGRRSLEIIDQEARRLTHLVENVLQFSRAERQLVRLSVVPTDLACQVQEAVESFAPLAQTRRVEVRAVCGDGCAASVDRGAFRQILLNLLDNAVKYGPAGQTVTVALACAGDRARVTVEDEGPGVPAAERARIFEPFYRLDRGGDGADTGSGIGLAVVRELVERHGGRVWVEAAARGGARFIVDLPRLSDGLVPEPPREERAGALASASGAADRVSS
jgi:signal transduction histidine kinase